MCFFVRVKEKEGYRFKCGSPLFRYTDEGSLLSVVDQIHNKQILFIHHQGVVVG